MEKRKNILDRISLSTRIIVNRFDLKPSRLAEIVQKGELAPEDGDLCELEAGGQVIARGKIVRKRGRHLFKVLETAEEGKK